MLHAPFDMPATRSAHILAANPHFGGDAITLLDEAGFRVGRTGNAVSLSDLIALDLLYVDLRGADAAAIYAMADEAMAARTRLDAALILRCDREQLGDAFAAFDVGAGALLCDPNLAELAAALALVTLDRGGGRVRETDDEAEKLKRLNEEVARIAETLARLVKHEPMPTAQPGTLTGERRTMPRPVPDADLPSVSSTRVRGAIRARRIRDQFFVPALFADPAWDMLLDLFAAELEHGRVSVSSLCIAAAVPPTTALRWITTLTSHELIEREPDPLDRRRAHIKLTARAGIAMRGYFNALDRAGLAAF